MDLSWLTLENIQHLTKDNQFLVGGIGTVAFSGLLYRFKSIPGRIQNFLYNWYTINIELNTIIYSTADLYRILDYLEKHTIRRFVKNFSLKDRSLIPGYGTSWARVDGMWVRYNRQQMTQGYQHGDQLNMTFFTRSRVQIDKFIENALPLQEIPPRLVINNHGNRLERPLRPWSSVFASDAIKKNLREKFTWFAENEAWYIAHGLPYKFCVLIEGEPGVGKSSLITAFASEFGMELEYVSNFYNMQNNTGNSISFDEGPSETKASNSIQINRRSLSCVSFKRAIILEDVDAMGELNRQSINYKASTDGQNIQELLNLMDSGTTPWGLVLFLTTNHPERLDPALRRPGRIDCTITLEKLKFTEAENMFVSFYGERKRQLWKTLEANYTPLTGSELQQAFYRDDPLLAIDYIKLVLNTKASYKGD